MVSSPGLRGSWLVAGPLFGLEIDSKMPAGLLEDCKLAGPVLTKVPSAFAG